MASRIPAGEFQDDVDHKECRHRRVGCMHVFILHKRSKRNLRCVLDTDTPVLNLMRMFASNVSEAWNPFTCVYFWKKDQSSIDTRLRV